ncbi:pth: peptidyl-tRNA hydrolase [Rubrobacter radiotolerans]|uniref:Peptidyl-tRNA hydrolase n=1 Tax=Rubrobacter radiotolerans TaxID=42256 RepID=A0A023X0V5_RUBRA|nr:pth: peptidyl-tRNA hydrolase [Rubrobacter radiotolerans]
MRRLRPPERPAASADAPGSDSSGSPRRKLPVVVGLGNPGRRYERTRHNVGFLVADELARRYGGSWRARKRSEVAEVGFDLKNLTLIKPQTMMNNSGAALAGYRAEDVIVVHDELDIPAGDVRVKVGGGHGGHNGLRSITNNVGREFVRVRVGIGRPPEGVSVTDYVLGGMDRDVKDAVPKAADAVEKILTDGPERAMDVFNRRD